MSFDKSYPNRKDRRKPFRGAKSFDTQCRCHGGCSYCRSNRLHSTIIRRKKADEEIKRVKKNGYKEED
jgi:hypothetical protein